MLFMISLGNICWENFFNASPIEEEGEGGPTADCSYNFGRHASEQKFCRAACAKTVAEVEVEAFLFPDGMAGAKEGVFEEVGPGRRGGGVCKKGGMLRDRAIDLEVILEGLDWAEVIVVCYEDQGATQLFGTPCPRDVQGGKRSLVAGIFESNGHRFLDVEFWVKGNNQRHRGFTQTTASPERGCGDSPASSMEGGGGVKAVGEGVKVVQGDQGALLFLEGGALFVSSCPGQLNPPVVTCQRGMVNIMPGLDP